MNWQEDFYEDFENYLKLPIKTTIKLEKKDKAYYKESIHASGLGLCRRKTVFTYFGLPQKPTTLAKELMFKQAEFVHALLIEYFKNSSHFDLLDYEKNVSDGLPDMVRGRFDFRVLHFETEKIILGDTKTAMPLVFKKYMDTLPKPNHKIQINTYALGLSELDMKYDEMAIFYFDRAGTNRPQIFIIDKMKPRALSLVIYENQLAVRQYKKNKNLPPKADEDWECDYCDFEGITCEGRNNKKVKNFQDWVNGGAK